MTQPNEQLISEMLDVERGTITIGGREHYLVPVKLEIPIEEFFDDHPEWLRALLEENKRLSAEKETCIETIKAYTTERIQMWKEREQTREELEQLKAEKESTNQVIQSISTSSTYKEIEIDRLRRRLEAVETERDELKAITETCDGTGEVKE